MKGFDLARVVEVDRIFTASTIEHTHCVFLGGPGETPAALRESIEFTERYLNPAQVYANLGIRILSGTKLLKQAVKAGIMHEGQGTFVPAYYVEPAILEDRATLDFVRDAYLSHKNWYLWWGLGGQDLASRAHYSVETVAEMQREYDYVMATKPRLRPARPKSKPVPVNLGTMPA